MNRHIIFALLSLFVVAHLSASENFQEVVVKEGNTLWGVANYYLKDQKRWPEILKHNKLHSNDPTTPLPGMKLKIPLALIKENLRYATIVWLKGNVQMMLPKRNRWIKAKPNMQIYPGDTIKAGKKSQAHIKLYSGDVVKVEQNKEWTLKPEETKTH